MIKREAMKQHTSFFSQTIRACLVGAGLAFAAPAFAAGLLVTIDNGPALQLQAHTIDVVIDGGYARTTWMQQFYNPGTQDREAIYEVPLPEEASLAEVSLYQGDVTLHGEVVAKAEAERIYGAEKAAGNDAGLATQDEFRRYRFAIARVPAQSTTQLQVTYYEPLKVEAGVGTYRYRLEEGGTDDGQAFWSREDRLMGDFAVTAEVRAGAPLAALRAPDFENAHVTVVDSTTQRLAWQGPQDRLNHDFVLYYQLEENLPGRVEVFAHKPSAHEAGTFLAVVTPGLDLKPLGGSDYVFVLDTSGSMQGKFGTMIQGIRASLKTFSAQDRFRIVLFNNNATEWTQGWINATPENVSQILAELHQLRPDGGTNLYDGIHLGLSRLDADRAASFILVTDAVANQGTVDPRHFSQLLRQYDVRFFAFLLGNSGNQPLIDVMTAASGGYSRNISNQQDIVGEILLAQSKIAYQALHDAAFEFRGSALPFDVTGTQPRKIFRGEQILLLGRYREAGELNIRLDARLTGEDKRYETSITLPAVEASRPELERLWALRQLREWDDPSMPARMSPRERQDARLELALAYQLVTDDTATLLLTDQQFAHYGIARENAARAAREVKAQQTAPAPARTDSHRPLTSGSSGGYGGGSLNAAWAAMLIVLAGLGWWACRPNSL